MNGHPVMVEHIGRGVYPIEVRRFVEIASKHHATPCGNIVASLVNEYLHSIVAPGKVVQSQHFVNGFGFGGFLKGVTIVATHVVIGTI